MILHQVSNSRGNYNYNAFIYNNAFYPPHFHANYELIYVFDGTANITVNGAQDILYQGELILLPPYTVHSLSVTDGKTWVGVFSEDFIVSYAKKNKHIRYSKFTCAPHIEDILKKFLFIEGSPEHFMRISYLYMVCNECVKNAVSDTIEISYRFIHDVVSYISDNIGQDITLKTISDAMNYEYHYFSCLFHQHFSMNFKDFMNFLRFDKACDLLTHKENAITAVAEQCGFGSIRNFNRVFKKMSGYTPREYKNQQLRNKKP